MAYKCSVATCSVNELKTESVSCRGLCGSKFHAACIGAPRGWLNNFAAKHFICSSCSACNSELKDVVEKVADGFNDIKEFIRTVSARTSEIIIENTSTFNEMAGSHETVNASISEFTANFNRILSCQLKEQFSKLRAEIITATPENCGSGSVISNKDLSTIADEVIKSCRLGLNSDRSTMASFREELLSEVRLLNDKLDEVRHHANLKIGKSLQDEFNELSFKNADDKAGSSTPVLLRTTLETSSNVTQRSVNKNANISLDKSDTRLLSAPKAVMVNREKDINYNIFVSRLDTSTTEAILLDYLTRRFQCSDISCKLVTPARLKYKPTYYSFKVSVPSSLVNDVLKMENWDNNTIVKLFNVSKKNKNGASNKINSTLNTATTKNTKNTKQTSTNTNTDSNSNLNSNNKNKN